MLIYEYCNGWISTLRPMRIIVVLFSFSILSSLVAEVMSSNSFATIPAGMKSYLTKRVFAALESWHGADLQLKHCKAEAIVNSLIIAASDSLDETTQSITTMSSDKKKKITEMCEGISKALANHPSRKHIEDLSSSADLEFVKKIYDDYQLYKQKNAGVFRQITEHHKTLIESNSTWDFKIQSVELDGYADAATAMGEKEWVRQGNKWIEEYSCRWFKDGGARTSYMKSFKTKYFQSRKESQGNQEIYDFKSFYDSLTTNLMASNESPDFDRKIRLVDVGSCYNPFKHCTAFDTVALDLCPTDPSVYKCDFLNLEIGPEGTRPMSISPPRTSDKNDVGHESIDDTDTLLPSFKSFSSHPSSQSAAVSATAATRGDTEQQQIIPASLESQAHISLFPALKQPPCLLQLPRNSFDVVSMSLVLCYLPTPAERRLMVAKARQLLIEPDSDSPHPHKCGILVIFEKESILSRPHYNQALMSNWKQAIVDLGFDYVTYDLLSVQSGGTRRAHGFVFKTRQLTEADVAAHQQALHDVRVGSGKQDTTAGGAAPIDIDVAAHSATAGVRGAATIHGAIEAGGVSMDVERANNRHYESDSVAAVSMSVSSSASMSVSSTDMEAPNKHTMKRKFASSSGGGSSSSGERGYSGSGSTINDYGRDRDSASGDDGYAAKPDKNQNTLPHTSTFIDLALRNTIDKNALMSCTEPTAVAEPENNNSEHTAAHPAAIVGRREVTRINKNDATVIDSRPIKVVAVDGTMYGAGIMPSGAEAAIITDTNSSAAVFDSDRSTGETVLVPEHVTASARVRHDLWIKQDFDEGKRDIEATLGHLLCKEDQKLKR